MKIFMMLAAFLTLQACAADKEEKYELKSPCAAADTQDAAPCARRPANTSLPDALPPRGGLPS